jgi:hypothetical protein
VRVESILDVELGRGSDYIRVHFDGGSVLVHRSLTAVEERLPSAIFSGSIVPS